VGMNFLDVKNLELFAIVLEPQKVPEKGYTTVALLKIPVYLARLGAAFSSKVPCSPLFCSHLAVNFVSLFFTFFLFSYPHYIGRSFQYILNRVRLASYSWRSMK